MNPIVTQLIKFDNVATNEKLDDGKLDSFIRKVL